MERTEDCKENKTAGLYFNLISAAAALLFSLLLLFVNQNFLGDKIVNVSFSYFCMKFHAKFKIVFLFNEPFGLPRPLPASFRSIAAFWVDDRLLCGTGSE